MWMFIYLYWGKICLLNCSFFIYGVNIVLFDFVLIWGTVALTMHSCLVRKYGILNFKMISSMCAQYEPRFQPFSRCPYMDITWYKSCQVTHVTFCMVPQKRLSCFGPSGPCPYIGPTCYLSRHVTHFTCPLRGQVTPYWN